MSFRISTLFYLRFLPTLVCKSMNTMIRNIKGTINRKVLFHEIESLQQQRRNLLTELLHSCSF